MSYVAFTLRKRGKKADAPLMIMVQASGQGNVPRNASGAIAAKVAKEFEVALAPITPVIESLRKTLVASKPDKVIVEFGVEFQGQIGIPIVTSGSATANFKILVEWGKNE